MTKRKIMLITVCFAIFAISLLLSRQFFKSAGKRNMDVPAAGSEQIEDSKDTEEKRNTEEMTELEETERTAASEGAAEPEKVYSNGYSGGGETLALILGKKPELFTAALMCSSKWDGAYEPVTEAKTPVYFVIGESDEYYGSEPFKEAYQILYELYAEQGLAKSEIDNLLVLDIKKKNGLLGIRVRDTGIGIEKHTGNDIFKRFYRENKEYSREQGGTGLGLAICKEATEKMGGTIRYRSTKGEGSTFLVWIPVHNK